MGYSNMGPNLAPLRDMTFWNLSALDFDLLRSSKVKSDSATSLPIYDFLVVSNVNHMSISHHLAVIADQKIFSYLL